MTWSGLADGVLAVASLALLLIGGLAARLEALAAKEPTKLVAAPRRL